MTTPTSFDHKELALAAIDEAFKDGVAVLFRKLMSVRVTPNADQDGALGQAATGYVVLVAARLDMHRMLADAAP